MSSELARSARALGRDMNFFGSKEKDFVIQTKGRVKINFGDKFIELFNGSKFTTGDNFIKTTEGAPSSTDSDGFYFDEDTGTLYLKIGDKIYEIFSNAKLQDGFISYKEEQDLTGENQTLAKENIGSIFQTPEDAENSGGSGVVYIASENKAYILQNGVLYPITNNTEINIGDDSSSEGDGYYFDKTITIDVDEEGPVLIINGLNRCIRIGTEDNNTTICHGSDGGTINSNKSLVIKINDKKVINIKEGKVEFSAILNALKGIITDEIFSSNYEKGDPSMGEGKGWGIWIDQESGESYLQVDNILTKSNNPPVYLAYQEALNLIKTENVIPGKLYVVLDYQNEWEITPVEEIFGNKFPKEGFDPKEDSLDPSKYDDDSLKEPLFGVDRNVRPIILEGKSESSFLDEIQYFYREDSQDVLDMRYDIREDNYSIVEEAFNDEQFDISNTLLEFPNKGRIYYMRDSWNNEAPCDFKHFVNEKGEYIFTSPDNKDLSSLNTSESIVCANNKILDVSIRNSETLNPMILKGKSINSNTVGGTFENVVIGDSESTIEYNYFNGVIKNCEFKGVFTNNSIGCTMDSCTFDKDVINNEFNKDITNCEFLENVENNIFDMSLEESKFSKLFSNQFTGSMKKCEFSGEDGIEMRENQFVGDFSECIWNGNVYSNTIRVDTVEKCTFKKDVIANQATSSLWSENTFEDTIAYNIFQANVVQLTTEGYTNNNQFIGRIENVYFYKDASNPNYGINNNIVNGLFRNCNIYVDFSHNTITGPIENSSFNIGESEQSNCLFNYNDIKAASINTLVTNGDCRRNTIKAEVFGPATLNGDFESNTLIYFNMRGITTNKMLNCTGKGENFIGTLDAEFDGCEFSGISNCTFRSAPIKFAKFRHSFGGQNFDSNDSIKDLDLLYDENHQVDVFFHKGKVEVTCQSCISPIKGEIKMFNGDISKIPEGWHICDGSEGTPNLIDKFIKADSKTGESTDEDSMDYPFEINSENVPVGDHAHTYTTGGSDGGTTRSNTESSSTPYANTLAESEGTTSEPTSGTDKTLEIKLPRYYSLIFIMKL